MQEPAPCIGEKTLHTQPDIAIIIHLFPFVNGKIKFIPVSPVSMASPSFHDGLVPLLKLKRPELNRLSHFRGLLRFLRFPLCFTLMELAIDFADAAIGNLVIFRCPVWIMYNFAFERHRYHPCIKNMRHGLYRLPVFLGWTPCRQNIIHSRLR